MTRVCWMSLRGAREEGAEKQRQRGVRKALSNALVTDLVLLVAEAAAETSLEGGNMALAIFIPVLIISLLLGGAYVYLTRWGERPGWGTRLSIALAAHAGTVLGSPLRGPWGAGMGGDLGGQGWPCFAPGSCHAAP